MPPRILLLTLLSVSLSGLAQVAFKFGVSTPGFRNAFATPPSAAIIVALCNPGVLGGLALYAVGTLTWLTVLSRTDLSLAYPFVALSFMITSAAGWLIFHEALSPGRLAGLALVVGGVVLCGRG
jgi:drug/metabolite transporter (DMT)-like permease